EEGGAESIHEDVRKLLSFAAPRQCRRLFCITGQPEGSTGGYAWRRHSECDHVFQADTHEKADGEMMISKSSFQIR
ncbi:MAG: hypothetical protein II772_02870, partial [Lachnospiraceae bacterium]|nr:hypothetical protein [Lachnospiraceae bacterium]